MSTTRDIHIATYIPILFKVCEVYLHYYSIFANSLKTEPKERLVDTLHSPKKRTEKINFLYSSRFPSPERRPNQIHIHTS